MQFIDGMPHVVSVTKGVRTNIRSAGVANILVAFANLIETSRQLALSVGAVNVRTGQFTYFDNAEMTIRSEHIMASSALPPGFPPVEIDGEYYWDGGLFSNTPLEYVLDYSQRRSRLTFQVDLFNSQGQLPTNLDEVSERDKDIRYCSRTNVCSKAFRDRHNVRHAINELYKLLPPELASTEQAKRLYEYGCVTEMESSDLSTVQSSPRARLRPTTSVARRWKSVGSRGHLTRVLCCTRRHGLRRLQRRWACECSMC